MFFIRFRFVRSFLLAALIGLPAVGALASVQTFNITTPGGPNGFFYNVTSGSTNFGHAPTIHLKVGDTYTLAVNCDSAHLFFITTNPAASCNNSQNYYLQNPAAFSSSVLASPKSVATVDFTPPSPATVYFFCRNHCFMGAFVIDPVLPDATSGLTVNPMVLPTNGTAIVTITPRNSGNVIAASETNFILGVTGGGGTFSAITPATGTNLTATFTAGTNAGTFDISNSIAGAATTAVIVLTNVPLTSFTVSFPAGAIDPNLTAQGFSNLPLSVQASQNFLIWSNLGAATSSAAGFFQFVDTNGHFLPKRFYRLAYP